MGRRHEIAAAVLAAACIGLGSSTATTGLQADVTVHEWGTFTTVAGPDGQAIQWLPLGGPTDLPCFVEFYKNRLVKILPGTVLVADPSGSPTVMPAANYGKLFDYDTARSGLKGTVRMETPVLYFYSARPADVKVSVRFPQGLFTEWYPRAQVDQLPSFANVLAAAPKSAASIEWAAKIRPGTRPTLPSGDTPSHYYAARDTDAAPIQSSGQDERFLFYRGVGGFSVPVSAKLREDGSVSVRNLGSEPLPEVVIFARRSGRIGYRFHGALSGEAVLPAPVLDNDTPALRRDLIDALTTRGLYRREAEAMVNTWRDSWFDDGTRVFYILPSRTVDAILPLAIDPKPSDIVRVFVGRVDLVTPQDLADVRGAFAANNRAVLTRYGRLLSVIGERILATTTDEHEKTLIGSRLDETFRSFLTRAAACDEE